MAVLTTPSFIKVHPNISVSKPNLIITTGRNRLTHVAAVATINANTLKTNTTPQTKELHQLINSPNHNMLEELTFRPVLDVNYDRKSGFSEPIYGIEVDGLIEKEAGVIIQRLEIVVERVRELELEKLMGKVKGEISYEESILVENMSREIVSKFLEKPIQYLRSSCGKLEDKLKELNFLVGILEESCLAKEKINIHA